MAKDPYQYFRIEAKELLDGLSKGVLELEKGEAPADLVAKLLRYAHTLKGAARVVKQVRIAERAHEVEEVLAPLREGAAKLQRGDIDKVLALLDSAAADVQALAAPEQAAPVAPAAPAATAPKQEELRRAATADVSEMDAMLSGLFEAGVKLRGLRGQASDAARGRNLASVLVEHLAPGRAGVASGAKARAIADELQGILARLDAQVLDGVQQLERELGQVRESAERLRLTPASGMFAVLQRAARDAGQALGKRVTFAGRGGAVRLDAATLAVVQPALVQAVRNAVAHGIELPSKRAAAGKPADGRVELEVVRRGSRVTFACIDDGAGIDVAAVRRALGAKVAADAPVEQVFRVLLEGGSSTATQATQQSGRGIGLDVVREAAAQLSGEVKLDTKSGQGTRVELTVPVSASALEALFVEAGGVRAAIPLEAVRHTRRLSANEISRTGDGDFVLHAGASVPFVPLARTLKVKSQGSAGAVSAVLVEGRAGVAAFGVERLLGSQSVVLRPLPKLAFSEALVAGASLDAEGVPQVVLDPEGLVLAALGAHRAAVEAPSRSRLPVLVIDDSVTTRMLEQSILESAGYPVETATSAEEGLEKARARPYGLFLCDVEMPGIDGFTFVERTRADAELRHVPVILITSRGDAADQERGVKAGASAYLVKSEFDQVRLLALVEKLSR